MSDEAIVEAIGRCIGLAMGHTFADVRTMTPGPNTLRIAKNVLAALRSEGYEFYWPEACETVEVEDGGAYADYHTGEPRQAEPFLHGSQVQETRCLLALGTYRLVPLPAESEEDS